jgi:hypothetical protein
MTWLRCAAGQPARGLLVAAVANGCLICILTTGTPALADERFFTYIQDADVLPKGGWEFEQWLTFRKGYLEGNHQFDQFLWDFREEMEYGFTDKLSGALYLNFQQEQIVAQQPDLEGSSKFSFKGVSAEVKYQLFNPYTDLVGIALYFEPTYNGNEQELEYKLIFSKNIGDKWVLAANAIFEQEWEQEGGETERESVLEFTFGAAYRFNPNWSVGLEARYHSVYEGSSLNEHLGSAWFLGPNIHYGTAKWWATFTLLPQISGNPGDNGGRLNFTEHQIYEARLIFGINF